MSAIRTVALLLTVAVLFAGAANSYSAYTSENHSVDEKRHVVLTRAQLNPPVRSANRRIRFSPNGEYILVQDDSRVRVFSRDPLVEKVYVPATRILSVSFSADSKDVVLAGINLQVDITSVTGQHEDQMKSLSSGIDHCAMARLSPMGNALACIDNKAKLHVLQIPDGRELIGYEVTAFPQSIMSFQPLAVYWAFSQPFGYQMTNSLPYSGSGSGFEQLLVFSPDGRYLLSSVVGGDPVAFDLSIGQKLNVPGPLRRRGASICFVGPDRVVTADPIKPEESVVLTFPSGEKLQKLSPTVRVQETSDTRYFLSARPSANGAEIRELQSEKAVAKLDDFAADIWDGNVAAYSADGTLSVYKLDDASPKKIQVSVGLLPMLRTAAVAPDLHYLMLSTGAEGAVFNTSDGARISSLKNIRGGWCGPGPDCYAMVANQEAKALEGRKIELASGQSNPVWTRTQEPGSTAAFHTFDNLYPSGGVLFSHAVEGVFEAGFPGLHNGLVLMPSAQHAGVLPYSLHALETQTGKELWKQDYREDPPVPFSDPQGDRFVLAWNARSAGGRRALKDNPAAAAELKQDKQAKRDSYFEVLDAHTGKSLGGALVQLDSRPEEFDSAFSEGDWLVLTKDEQRVFVSSLKDSAQALKIFGRLPSLHAARALLSVITEQKTVSIYDLRTGQKIRNYQTASPVAYTHFSADGQRLLVLTSDQMVYVLDVASGQ